MKIPNIDSDVVDLTWKVPLIIALYAYEAAKVYVVIKLVFFLYASGPSLY